MQKWVYHEKQSESMCAVHCLNSLFQGPVYDEVQLAGIARELDMKEALLYRPEFSEVVGVEGSLNVSEDGNFSVQVITKAIEMRGLAVDQVVSLDASVIPKENDPLDNDPRRCVNAFVCWLNHHWICIRKVHGFWFDMNSVNSAPQYLSYFRIELFLGELMRQGYFVYKVTGRIPEFDDEMRSAYPDNKTLHGKWLPLITDDRGVPLVLNDESPPQKKKKKKRGKQGAGRDGKVPAMSYEDQLRLAIEESLKPSQQKPQQRQKEQQKKQPPPLPDKKISAEDLELEYALALSLSMNDK